jgi:chemotaxis protein methyltransferase CheR
VARESGLFFDETKEATVRGVIQERLKALGFGSYDVYYRYLTGTGATSPITTSPDNADKKHGDEQHPARELQRLVDNLVVNETTFFRNKEHYQAIREEVLPRLIRRNQASRQLTLWSAGCSTGQEPYSLAIAIIETLEAQHEKVGGPNGWKVQIIASDISEKALKVAKAGRYRQEDLRNMSESQIARFFISLANPNAQTAPLDPGQLLAPNRISTMRVHDRVHYEVAQEVRALVHFGYFNLTRSHYPREKFHNFDMVLCENVTIYFQAEITKRVIDNIFETLNPGGWFFIGYSETLWQVSDRFKLINSNDTFYYQKPFPNEVLPPAYTRSRSLTGPLDLNALNVANKNERQRTTEDLSPKPKNPADPAVIRASTDKLRKLLEENAALKAVNANSIAEKPAIFEILGGLNGTNRVKEEDQSKTRPRPTENSKAAISKAETEAAYQEALAQGLKMMNEHDFESAQLYLEKANTLQPDNVEMLCAMAQLRAKLGDYDEAARLSRKAISINPLSEDAHLMLAMIYHREGQVRQSIEEFEKTIYINFDSVVAHMRLADIYRTMGQTNNALREYRNTIKALDKKRPDEIIEDLPVELLKRTCEQNINRLNRR